MRQERLNRYRTMLHEQLTLLVGETEREMASSIEAELPPGHPDPTDRATLEEERGFELRLKDRDRKLIGKIKDALRRIEAGTFGVCEECGSKIGEARLRARPVTTLCLDCKEDQERRERRE